MTVIMTAFYLFEKIEEILNTFNGKLEDKKKIQTKSSMEENSNVKNKTERY